MEMKVLVACEYSGTVRDAFNALGHNAMSADLLPSDTPGPHYIGDARDLLGEAFDLVIAHPPCTYLALSGVQYLDRPGRERAMRDAAGFFWSMSQFNAPRIAIENPVQHRRGQVLHGLGKATQYVQPWMFGHPETKTTGLWLFNLPPLRPTNNVKELHDSLPEKERQRLRWLPPTEDRWKKRSKTYPGIAAAMAEQWGVL